MSFSMSGITLPVRLLNFKGQKNNDHIVLNWQTAFEDNTSYYSIERSTDGTTFERIGTVNATGNATGSVNYYSFTDVAPLRGRSYYRLVMVDADGQFTYSPVINMNTDASTGIKIYPSILEKGSQLFIQSQSDLRNNSIVISDMSGKKLYEQHIPIVNATQTLSVSLPNNMISNGIYLVQFYSERNILEKKMIIIH